MKHSESAATDNPRTARESIYNLHGRYCQRAGGILINDQGDRLTCDKNQAFICEISPLVSYEGENLETYVKGKTLKSPIIIEREVENEVSSSTTNTTTNGTTTLSTTTPSPSVTSTNGIVLSSTNGTTINGSSPYNNPLNGSSSYLNAPSENVSSKLAMVNHQSNGSAVMITTNGQNGIIVNGTTNGTSNGSINEKSNGSTNGVH